MRKRATKRQGGQKWDETTREERERGREEKRKISISTEAITNKLTSDSRHSVDELNVHCKLAWKKDILFPPHRTIRSWLAKRLEHSAV